MSGAGDYYPTEEEIDEYLRTHPNDFGSGAAGAGDGDYYGGQYAAEEERPSGGRYEKEEKSSVSQDRYALYQAQNEADQARKVEDSRKAYVRQIDTEEYSGLQIGGTKDKSTLQREKEAQRELYRLQLETDVHTRNKVNSAEDRQGIEQQPSGRKPFVRKSAQEDDSSAQFGGFQIGHSLNKDEVKRQKAREQEIYRQQLERDVFSKPIDSERSGIGASHSARSRDRDRDRDSGSSSPLGSSGMQFGGRAQGNGRPGERPAGKLAGQSEYRRQLDADLMAKKDAALRAKQRENGGYADDSLSAAEVYGGGQRSNSARRGGGGGGGSSTNAYDASEQQQFQIGGGGDAASARRSRQAEQQKYRQQLAEDQYLHSTLSSARDHADGGHSARHRRSAGRSRAAEQSGGHSDYGGLQLGGDEAALREEKRRLALQMLEMNQQAARSYNHANEVSGHDSRSNRRAAKGYSEDKSEQIRRFEDAPGMTIGDSGDRRKFGGSDSARQWQQQPPQSSGYGGSSGGGDSSGFLQLGGNEQLNKERKRQEALRNMRANDEAALDKKARARAADHIQQQDSSFAGYENYRTTRQQRGRGGSSAGSRREDDEASKFEHASGGLQIGQGSTSAQALALKKAQQMQYAMQLQAQQSDAMDSMIRDRPYSGAGGVGTGMNIGADPSRQAEERDAKAREYRRMLDEQKYEDLQRERFEEMKRNGY